MLCSWLESGGDFQSVEEPVRFLLQLFDYSTQKEYRTARDKKAGTDNEVLTIKSVVQNIAEIIIARKPLANIHISILKTIILSIFVIIIIIQK